MGFIKEVLEGLGKIFIVHPEQYVENSDDAAFLIVVSAAIKDGSITKEEAIELIRAQKNSFKIGEESQARVESDIQILPSDNSDHRTDLTMETVEATNVDIRPAGELENNVRQSGGIEREGK